MRGVIGYLFILTGMGVLAFQAYFFLRYGVWLSLSPIELHSLVTQSPVPQPKDWLGMYQIVNVIPSALVFFVYGVFMAKE